MKRYFDGSNGGGGAPVNDRILEVANRTNKIPAATIESVKSFFKPRAAVEDALSRVDATLFVGNAAPLPPTRAPREFLNQHPNYKRFGEYLTGIPRGGIAERVARKERAQREYEPLEAPTLLELQEMFPEPTGYVVQNKQKNEEIKKVLTKEERMAKATTVLAANQAAFVSGASFPKLLAPAGNAAPRPPQPPKAPKAPAPKEKKKKVIKVKTNRFAKW